jgi:hypothetical protein
MLSYNDQVRTLQTGKRKISCIHYLIVQQQIKKVVNALIVWTRQTVQIGAEGAEISSVGGKEETEIKAREQTTST